MNHKALAGFVVFMFGEMMALALVGIYAPAWVTGIVLGALGAFAMFVIAGAFGRWVGCD